MVFTLLNWLSNFFICFEFEWKLLCKILINAKNIFLPSICSIPRINLLGMLKWNCEAINPIICHSQIYARTLGNYIIHNYQHRRNRRVIMIFTHESIYWYYPCTNFNYFHVIGMIHSNRTTITRNGQQKETIDFVNQWSWKSLMGTKSCFMTVTKLIFKSQVQ